MSNGAWQLHEVKNSFSELVNKALAEAPQTVARHGEEVVVILSKAEYNHIQLFTTDGGRSRFQPREELRIQVDVQHLGYDLRPTVDKIQPTIFNE
jgi:prevent-host-death family protein